MCHAIPFESADSEVGARPAGGAGAARRAEPLVGAERGDLPGERGGRDRARPDREVARGVEVRERRLDMGERVREREVPAFSSKPQEPPKALRVNRTVEGGAPTSRNDDARAPRHEPLELLDELGRDLPLEGAGTPPAAAAAGRSRAGIPARARCASRPASRGA